MLKIMYAQTQVGSINAQVGSLMLNLVLLFVAQHCSEFVHGQTKEKGGMVGKSFTLHHCCDILENDDKWRNCLSNEITNKGKNPSTSVGEGLVVDTDDEGSSSPTPPSSVSGIRPDGRKKVKI